MLLTLDTSWLSTTPAPCYSTQTPVRTPSSPALLKSIQCVALSDTSNDFEFNIQKCNFSEQEKLDTKVEDTFEINETVRDYIQDIFNKAVEFLNSEPSDID